MKLIAIGDSITKGTYSTSNGGGGIANPNFVELVRRGLGYEECVNYGQNGISVSGTSDTFPESAAANRCEEYQCGDLVLFAMGTNDFTSGVKLGKPSDDSDISLYGALAVVFRTLKRKQEGATVVVISPLHRKKEENALGCVLEDYCKAIESRAQEYGFWLIRGFDAPFDARNEVDRELYVPDGLHPNPDGHASYARYILEELKKKRILEREHEIIR